MLLYLYLRVKNWYLLIKDLYLLHGWGKNGVFRGVQLVLNGLEWLWGDGLGYFCRY